MTSANHLDQQAETALPQERHAIDSQSTATITTAPSLRTRLWWAVRFVSFPFLLFVAGTALLGLLGVAQKAGWISAGGPHGGGLTGGAAEADVDYICPMMCTPPLHVPGRCPTCAMELVPAPKGGGGDERSIVVDPASRRVANIQTVSVRNIPMIRTIKAIGELHYDEGTRKTISAYSDGRFDQLYVDFTGAVVEKGQRLASFYSPDLFSAQVAYLESGTAVRSQSAGSPESVAAVNRRLHSNLRQRLIELGMSDAQIEDIDRTETAQSRLDIVAPMSGTVIEKMAVAGEYVKEGQPVFRLADLSTVWLMLELFPEDVPAVRYAHAVEATMKSLPGRTFTGRIAFIDPDVDPKSRTVKVRVVIDNKDGWLRIGDYAKARITVPVGNLSGERTLVYDPELAGKWISPRHPHIVSEHPGMCPLSGLELVSTSSFGFTARPESTSTATVIPRDAVLMAADHSVVYVETEPGRFEIRRIIVGAAAGHDIVVVKGLAEGEAVATSGNFLLDSQMQLAGNPSLIDPTRATPPMDMVPGFDAEMLAAIHELPDNDQPAALQQVICPVTEFRLGSMGVPPRVMIDGKPVFLCCEGCRKSLLRDPETHLRKLQEFRERGEVIPTTAESDVPPPAIGEVQTDFSQDQFPAIGKIKPVSSRNSMDDEEPTRSASTDSEAGRIPQ